ncbi:hypothetical protein GCM10009558_092870 [Virgisporangium aurantiacum]
MLSAAAFGDRTVTAVAAASSRSAIDNDQTPDAAPSTPSATPLAAVPSCDSRFRVPDALVGLTHAATVKLRAVSSTGPVVAMAELVPLKDAAPPRSVVQVMLDAAPVLLPPVSRAVDAPADSASGQRAVGANDPLWTVRASGRPILSLMMSWR